MNSPQRKSLLRMHDAPSTRIPRGEWLDFGCGQPKAETFVSVVFYYSMVLHRTLASLDPQRHIDKPDGRFPEAGKPLAMFVGQCPSVWNISTQDIDVLLRVLVPSTYRFQDILVENWDNVWVQDVQERCANW